MSNRQTDDIAHGVPPVAISSTSTLDNRTGSWKYIRPIYRDRVAPCNEGCPVGIDIEGYMNLLRENRVEEARDLLLRENPMPAVTGRVCYHPCENACNRRKLDGAVSIHAVERMLGNMAMNAPLPEKVERRHPEKAAVIGSGPAGLSCAYFLVQMGYGVTVFESAPEPGGVLRLGIPDYRLPKDVLSWEVERIRSLGAEIRCNARVGTDIPFSDLDEYEAVFLATGVHKSQPLRVEDADVPGIRSGLSFLREVNFDEPPELGQKVVVIGGGNTAMDCARTALRLGSEPVVLYRRTRAEMPAIDEEVEEAEREGIEFHFLAAPVSVRKKDGRMEGLECIRMRLGDVDASGRRRPVPVEGSEFFVPADTVLTAIGEAPEFQGFPEDLDRDDWMVQTDKSGATNRPGFFAGGDIVDQPHTVAHALGSGKKAALAIDRYLGRRREGKDAAPEENGDLAAYKYGRMGNVSFTWWRGDDPILRHGPVNEVVPYEDLNVAHFPMEPVHSDRHLTEEESRGNFTEVNRGLSSVTALQEAHRCFNCGVCNQCELCLIYCPDLAITRNEEGTGFLINYDYCKGCGVCNAECPRGAMAMTREGL